MPRKNGEPTKAEQRARRAAWALAVQERRVVRFEQGFRAYPTIAARDAGLAQFRAAGIPAVVVDPVTDPEDN